MGKTQHTSTHSSCYSSCSLAKRICIEIFEMHRLLFASFIMQHLCSSRRQGKEHYSPDLTNAHREYSCHSCPWKVSCVLVEPSLRPSRNLNRIKVAYLTTTRQSKARHSIALSPMWRMCPQRNAAFQLFSTLLLLRKLLI